MNTLTDLDFIKALADCRVVSTRQAVEFLNAASGQMGRRTLRRMEDEGLIVRTEGILRGGKGRPEALITLGMKGRQALKTTTSLDLSSPDGMRQVPHSLLINWVWIHLRRLEKSGLSSRFISASSPCAVDATGASILRVFLRADRKGDQHMFIPDGTFMLTHQNRSLLFFLEADLGTEALVNGKKTDIRQKVIHYRQFLATKGYKSFESIFQTATFRGFRLLLICNTPARKQQLCRVVRETAPADFVWIADESSLHAQGLEGRIFSVGGRDAEPQSILGSLANAKNR